MPSEGVAAAGCLLFEAWLVMDWRGWILDSRAFTPRQPAPHLRSRHTQVGRATPSCPSCAPP